ncbi:cbb3-type cytochrome oxidase assembly protein CcoS [Ensifer sp. ENS11]|uniref:cbb3-type cytochrome oxidase assembly protein CcoS n=1 Tax=Ensifer sp. ENS11 TaxID=2769291 RepID=UPI002811CC7F|nr:cbb3-type cytochrome oxidase assembly protein CcoS [Ensifer sp. ENS11]
MVLIPVALLMGAVGLCAFLRSVRAGQFRDLDCAASLILLNDGGGASGGDRPTPHRERQRCKGVSQVGD